MTDREKRRKYKAEIKKAQEYYNSKSDRKFSKNKHWKEDWKGYVEYTYPWDGGSILEMIVYRLEILKINLDFYSHHVGSEEEVKEIEHVIALGKKILNYDYEKEAHEFSGVHCAHVTYIYKKLSYQEEDLLGEIIQYRSDDSDDFFNDSYIANWCTEHHMKKEDISTSYGGRWDDPKNHDVWLEMIKKANAERAEDKKEFFDIIANKLESWWD